MIDLKGEKKMKSLTHSVKTIPQPSPTVPSTPAWYVVETPGNSERLAKYHLARQGFEVYLPMRASLSKRTDAARATPLFPRYLFVRIDPTNPRWSAVRSSIGVRGLLRAGDKPAQAPLGLVEAIRARESFGLVKLNDDAAAASALQSGDIVRVHEGKFSGFEGVFDRQHGKRVIVLLSFFGRTSPVSLLAHEVRRSA